MDDRRGLSSSMNAASSSGIGHQHAVPQTPRTARKPGTH
jgi:hypothetical protein